MANFLRGRSWPFLSLIILNRSDFGDGCEQRWMSVERAKTVLYTRKPLWSQPHQSRELSRGTFSPIFQLQGDLQITKVDFIRRGMKRQCHKCVKGLRSVRCTMHVTACPYSYTEINRIMDDQKGMKNGDTLDFDFHRFSLYFSWVADWRGVGIGEKIQPAIG